MYIHHVKTNINQPGKLYEYQKKKKKKKKNNHFYHREIGLVKVFFKLRIVIKGDYIISELNTSLSHLVLQILPS